MIYSMKVGALKRFSARGSVENGALQVTRRMYRTALKLRQGRVRDASVLRLERAARRFADLAESLHQAMECKPDARELTFATHYVAAR